MATPAAAGTGGGEVSIPMPAAGGELQRRERTLNHFVRFVAFGEWAGNAFGALAFLWATVVLLGGFCSSLDREDFWFVTVMIFIEAFRIFSRSYRLDNQSLFGTTGALRWISSYFSGMLARPQEGDEVVLIMGLWIYLIDHSHLLGVLVGILKVALLILMSRRPRRPRPCQTWALLIAYLPLTAYDLSVLLNQDLSSFEIARVITIDIVVVLALFLLNMRPRRISNLTSIPCGRKLVSLAKVISAVWLAYGLVSSISPSVIPPPKPTFVNYSLSTSFATLVLALGSLQTTAADSLFCRWIDAIMHILFLWHLVFTFPEYFFFFFRRNPSTHFVTGLSFITLLVLLLIGNLQVPAAVVQVLLSSLRFHRLLYHHDYYPMPQGTSPNMVPAIAVFYVMALCQGSLYIMASILGFFSFFPCRSFVRRSGFRGQWGAKAIRLYYQHAYATCMETGLLSARKTMSLAGFAMESLRTNNLSHEVQLAGVLVLHRLLQERDDSSSQELISGIISSDKALSKLIGMLAWTDNVRDREISLFAARITAELAGRLRISGIPGMVKSVSSLLLVSSTQPQGQEPSAQTTSGDGMTAGNQPTDRPQSVHGAGNDGWCPWVRSCWRRLKQMWSIPEEPSLTLQDSFPVLGMVILERLARDPDKCTEISKAPNLISKIIGLMSYTIDHENSDGARQNAVICSSLNLVRRLAITGGEIGVTLRQELWKNPFLLSNLADTLEDSRSNPEVWEPAMDVIAKLALDEDARKEIGSSQVITSKLIHAFLGRDGTGAYYNQALRMTAGEALANLATESTANCLAILEEPGYEVIKDLKNMLSEDEYRCVAGSLLQNLCAHSIDKLHHPGASEHLPSALPVVIENIMSAEGKQLEVIIGLAAHIYYVIPKCFVDELHRHTNKSGLVKKLVDTLNSNRKPNPEYPRMRRVTIDMAILSAKWCSGNAYIFKEEGMMEALSKVEKTPSKVEKYRVFFGNEGVVVERGLPLRDLAARAKEEIDSASSTSGRPSIHD